MARTSAVALNMLTVIVGRAAAILLALATTALLARYLGSTGYGQYRSALAILGLAALVSNLGLHQVVLRELAHNRDDAAATFGNALALRALAASACFLLAGVAAWALPLDDVVRMGVAVGGLGFLALSCHQLLVALFQERLQQHGPMAAEVSAAALLLLLAWWCVAAEAGVLAVIGATAAAGLWTLLVSWLWARRLVTLRLRADMQQWQRLLTAALPLAITNFFSLALYRADIVLLSLLRGGEEVGLYALGTKILDTLVGLVLMFAGLIMPELSRLARTSPAGFRDRLHDSATTACIAGFGGGVLLVAFAAEVATLLGGAAFRETATALRVLAITFAVVSLSLILRHAVTALDRQRELVAGYALATVCGLMAYILLIPGFGAVGAAAGLLTGETVICLAAWRILRAEMALPRLSRMLLKVSIAAGCCFACAYLLALTAIPWPIGLTAAGTAYIVALLLLGVLSPSLVDPVRQLLRRTRESPGARLADVKRRSAGS